MENLRMKLLFAFSVLLLFSAFTTAQENAYPQVYIADYKDNKQCAISFTFDDGLLDQYTVLFPEMEKVGFKGTFWVCGKIIEEEVAQQSKPRMTWAQMKEMDARGHEISNHGWSHTNLKRISLDEVKIEVTKNDSIIEAMIGKKPTTFCYPFNSRTDEIIQIASEGRVGTRIRQYAVGGDKAKSTIESLDRKVEELLIAGDWGVAMTHGITSGYDYFPDPNVLWEHFRRVKAQEDKIWIATFADVSAYVKERDNIELDVVKKKSSYKVTPRLNLDAKLFTSSLTMVVKNGKSQINATQDGKILPVKKIGEEALFDFDPYGGAISISFKLESNKP